MKVIREATFLNYDATICDGCDQFTGCMENACDNEW